jgi:hypothetical protein
MIWLKMFSTYTLRKIQYFILLKSVHINYLQYIHPKGKTEVTNEHFCSITKYTKGFVYSQQNSTLTNCNLLT